MNLVELYNPTTLIMDTRVRDFAEYYKDKFFNSDILYSEIVNDIDILLSNYTSIEKQLFFARMLYPTYFFDAYEKIILYGDDVKILNNIVSKSTNYEKLLSNIYMIIKKTTYIDNIDWLIT